MSGHTPGPWGMPDSGKGLVSKKTKTGWDGMIATADCGDYARSRSEGLANACLIAAAPTLLEALRDTVMVLESIRQEWEAEYAGDYNPFRKKFEAQARAAIAQAEGKE